MERECGCDDDGDDEEPYVVRRAYEEPQLQARH